MMMSFSVSDEVGVLIMIAGAERKGREVRVFGELGICGGREG